MSLWEDKKPFDRISAILYITTHPKLLNDFLKSFRKEDYDYIVNRFIDEDPVTLANILKNNYGRGSNIIQEKVIADLSSEGVFTIIFGMPRAGKTASALWLAEKFIERNIRVYWFGYSSEIAKYYPEVIQTFDLRGMEDGVLIYDELLLTAFGRNAGRGEVKERVLNFPTISHHGIAVIMLSQSHRFDPLLKDLITFVWFKPFSISSILEKELSFKPYMKYLIPQNKNGNLLYNTKNNECCMFGNGLPSFWNDKISKSMSPIKSREEARIYAGMLMNAGINERELPMFLNQRNINLDDVADTLDLLCCDKCGSTRYQRYGKRDGIQRYRCNKCRHIFNE